MTYLPLPTRPLVHSYPPPLPATPNLAPITLLLHHNGHCSELHFQAWHHASPPPFMLPCYEHPSPTHSPLELSIHAWSTRSPLHCDVLALLLPWQSRWLGLQQSHCRSRDKHPISCAFSFFCNLLMQSWRSTQGTRHAAAGRGGHQCWLGVQHVLGTLTPPLPQSHPSWPCPWLACRGSLPLQRNAPNLPK